jgi:hypothetical protein
MKIRSLLLGSVAAAGLSTGAAHAADLGVLTSLDVCDALGLSGLTISSDTNCLQITGEVKYRFNWGDYSADAAADVAIPNGSEYLGDQGSVTFIQDDGATDWDSRFDAWIKFVATADSDFGPAKAVLKLKQVSEKEVNGSTWSTPSYSGFSGSATVTVVGSGLSLSGTTVFATYATANTVVGSVAASGSASGSTWVTGTGSTTDGVVLDEAYVSIGDSTVIMAGKKGSIMNKSDDAPLNWLGLFNSNDIDAGVAWTDGLIDDAGHVIQITTDLGNGLSASAGLENLDGSDATQAGTAVGVLAYSGDGLSAHVTVAADGVLSGEIKDWGVHAGFAGTFDNFKVVAAGAFDSNEYWNVLASASATFDMFTIAASVEAAEGTTSGGPTADDYWGAGASITAAVTDTVTLNVGGKWAHEVSGADSYQVAASVTAAVTDSLSVTGEVGYVDDSYNDLFYGSAKLAWAPGGQYTSSVKGTVTSEGGYKIESEFKKTFE